jgi:hypothetical protein
MNFPWTYYLSDVCPYEKLICRDAGPRYAESMGWKTQSIEDIGMTTETIHIIDPRLTESEGRQLETRVRDYQSKLFLFRIIDPCFETCYRSPYFKLLFRLSGLNNVGFLTTYQPAELVESLRDAAGPDKMHQLPYPYQEHKGQQPPWDVRQKKILFAGSSKAAVYPERAGLLNKTRRHPIHRFRLSLLPHPGYPDVGQKQRHRIIGNNFLNHASKFRFLYVSGARCHAELLKFSECAAAGCLPVGIPALGMPNETDQYFFTLDPNHLYRDLNRLWKEDSSELRDRAIGYRKTMKQERSPALLNENLTEFIHERFVSFL